MKSTLTLTTMLLFPLSSTWAQTDEQVTAALSNVQHEMARCIAYSTIVASCLRSQDAVLADQYDKIAEHLLLFSNQIGHTIGMTQDAMDSRMTLEWSEMDKLIRHNCVNISSLTSRYAYRCKQVVESGDSVLLEYLEEQ